MARLRIVGFVAAAGAFAFFALTIYAVSLIVMYSPVYRPLRCTTHTPVFGEKQIVGGVHGNLVVSGNSTTVCENFNHYEIRISSEDGDVIAFPDKLNLGKLDFAPVTVPGNSELTLLSNIYLNFSLALVPKLQRLPKITVVGKIATEGDVELSIFGVRTTAVTRKLQYCGYIMMTRTLEAGPSTCSSSLDTFRPPPSVNDDDLPYNVQVDDELITENGLRLYIGVGGIALVSTLFGLSLLAFSRRVFVKGKGFVRRRHKGGKESESESSDGEGSTTPFGLEPAAE